MYENYSDMCSVITGAISMAYIKEVLGIIVLVLSILNILINLGLRIYHKIKNKKYSDIPKDIDDAIYQLKGLDEEEEDKNE